MMEPENAKFVDKPLWGKEEIIVNLDNYCGKKLHIKEGHRFSLQYHKKKHETHYVEKGLVLVERGLDGMAGKDEDEIRTFIMREGETMKIPPYTTHRCSSLNGTAVIVESSTHHEDLDTYRLEETIPGVTNRVPEEIMKKYSQGVVVAVSGYFDPLHVGHIEYIHAAKKLGDKLIVILNNDVQAKLKKGYVFMPQEERAKIIRELLHVDDIFVSIDNDLSVKKSLEFLKPNIFAKGAEKYLEEIPEKDVCDKLGIKIVYGLGEKIQSSSKLVENSLLNKILNNKNG